MKIPNNTTEAEVLSIIDKILKRYTKRATFGIYDKDDIYQEGFIMAINALENYNEDSGPLENFLAKHIKNRLLTLRRDKFIRSRDNCNNCETFNAECEGCQRRRQTYLVRKNLNQAIDIHVVNQDNEKNMVDRHYSEADLDNAELLTLINKYLPIELREDYLRMRDGLYVSKATRNIIEVKILEIIEFYT